MPGAGGGVGHFTAQIAEAAGAEVTDVGSRGHQTLQGPFGSSLYLPMAPWRCGQPQPCGVR